MNFKLHIFFLIPLIFVSCAATPLKKVDKPNIIFIMVDDMGKEWVTCYGAKNIDTPHIDKLAAEGMKFNKAYSMPQCTPTRVTLLTGQYPFRTGWANHWDVPRWGAAYFDWKVKEHTTFAQVLKTAGYKTAIAGKWQINDFRVEPNALEKHGFDDWCMWTGYEGGNGKVSSMRYQDAYIHTRQGSRTYKGEFGPDIYCNFLIDFMKKNKEHPMMVYFPMTLIHTPFVVTPDEPDAESQLGKHKAMVRYCDKLVGKITKALVDLKIRDKTVLIFTTDNGTARPITGHIGSESIKGSKARKVEAGICAPFIVSAPGMISEGVEVNALIDFSDILPTFAELSGATLPTHTLDGISFAPILLGKSTESQRDWILSMGYGNAWLSGEGLRTRHDYTDRVIRTDRYKAWVNTRRQIEKLYDLEKDPYEKNNLLEVTNAKNTYKKQLDRFKKIMATMPHNDHRPQYSKRKASPWDRKPSDKRPGSKKK